MGGAAGVELMTSDEMYLALVEGKGNPRTSLVTELWIQANRKPSFRSDVKQYQGRAQLPVEGSLQLQLRKVCKFANADSL